MRANALGRGRPCGSTSVPDPTLTTTARLAIRAGYGPIASKRYTTTVSSEGHIQRQSFSAQMREVIRKRSESLVRDHERRFADVGRLVAETRRARGMSQQELAVLCGTTQSAIARLERGGRPPRIDTLLSIAEALDCDLKVELVPRKH